MLVKSSVPVFLTVILKTALSPFWTVWVSLPTFQSLSKAPLASVLIMLIFGFVSLLAITVHLQTCSVSISSFI